MEKLSYLKSESLIICYNLSKISSEVSRAIRQCECGQQLKYVIESGNLEQHLQKAYWCKQRSCPICNYIKSIKWRLRIFTGLPKLLEDYKNHHFLLLTLTQRNCHQAELRNTIKSMEKAWKEFNSKNFPGIGYIKTLEITRSYDCFYANEYIGRFGSTLIKKWQKSLKFHNCWIPELWKEYASEMVHPHFHCLIMVKPEYFNENYIDHLTWVTRWRLALKTNYNPSVRINLIKNLKDAIFEVTKYCIKPIDLKNDRLGSFIPRQLHKLKLISIGGIFKKYFNEEQLDSIDNNLISGTEYKQSGLLEVTYNWSELYNEYNLTSISLK